MFLSAAWKQRCCCSGFRDVGQMTNEERFARVCDRMQNERAAFLSGIQGFSQTQLDFKLSESSWSIGEVAHHVGLAEKMVQDNLKELFRSGSGKRAVVRKVGFEELPMNPQAVPRSLMRLAPLLVPFSILMKFTPEAMQSFMLANPILKIRTAPSLEPKAGMPRAELVKYLRELREATLTILDPARSWDLSLLSWEHPLMGKHHVYGTMEVMANHDRRHRIQIEGVRKSPKFPAS